MKSQHYVCVNCLSKYYISTSRPLYRCGDAYVCSSLCAQKRLEKIMEIDPLLSSPLLWKEPDYEIYNDSHKNDLLQKENNIELPKIQSNQPYSTADDIIKAQKEENDFVESLNIDTKNVNIDTSPKILEKKIHPYKKRKTEKLLNPTLCKICFKAFSLCVLCLVAVISISSYTH